MRLDLVCIDDFSGKAVEVKFIRDGKVQTVKIDIIERNIDKAAKPSDDDDDSSSEEGESGGKLGFSASNLSVDQAASLRIKNGVIIDQVMPESPAGEAQLQRGDIIHQINRQPIMSVTDLAAAVKQLQSGDTVVMQIERRGQLNFITLTVE